MPLLQSLATTYLYVLALGIPFSVIELVRPAGKVSYRKRLLRDLAALAAAILLGVAGAFLIDPLAAKVTPSSPSWVIDHVPGWLRFVIAAVLADLSAYWIHRALHTRLLWPIHRWHHVPEEMYWLAGGRISLVNGVLYSLPALWLSVFDVPPWAFGVFGIVSIATNHWVHANTTLRVPWLERLYIMPATHRVHHEVGNVENTRNFGAILIIWDTLFGTYTAPSRAQDRPDVGIGESPSTIRLLLGV